MSIMLQEIKQEDLEKELAANENLVLDFYSTECPPCEAVAPKFESLATFYGDDVRFVKIFRQGNRELSEKLGVKSSPTLIFYKNGKETGERLIGGIKKADIEKNLDALLPKERVSEIKSKISPLYHTPMRSFWEPDLEVWQQVFTWRKLK
jgi:thioredoxin reductase (NADPH)